MPKLLFHYCHKIKMCFSGVVNVLLTTPMWVVNTRLKLQGVKFRDEDLHQTHYRGIFGSWYFFVQKDKIKGVYNMWITFTPHLILIFLVRCFFTDHCQRRSRNTVERHSAVSHPRPQPGCAVHVLWSLEEESRKGREEGERTQEKWRSRKLLGFI